jgi:large repetitive protein
MAKATTRLSFRPTRRGVGVVAVVAVSALVVGLAVTSSGYEAQDTPRLETAVWVTRDDTGQYARVNTDLGEIDTVKAVDDPNTVVQSGARSVIVTQGGRQLWPVDSSNPLDFTAASAPVDEAPVDEAPVDGAPVDEVPVDEQAAPDPAATAAPEPAPQPTAGPEDSTTRAKSISAPSGTTFVTSAGRYIVYLTDAGKVFLGRVSSDDGSYSDPGRTDPVDPFGNTAGQGEDAPSFSATAVAVASDGEVVVYSAAEKSIRRFRADTGQFVGGPTTISDGPAGGAQLDLAIVGSRWVMSDPGAKKLWIDGRTGAIATGLSTTATLQQSSGDDGDTTVVYLADSNGLVSVDLASGTVSDPIITASGTPAAPVTVAGVTFAAWISPSGGTLWSSTDGERALTVVKDILEPIDVLLPVFRTNGDRAVLNESVTGMLWTVPTGELVPMEQWAIEKNSTAVGVVKVDDVSEEEPPVAHDDSFGVRRGGIARLPLLLNDSDPNRKDVLTIAPESIKSGLSSQSFGELQLVSNQQEATVRVRASSGTTEFSYAVTDGIETSKTARVALTIVPDNVNHDPKWCGVDDCVQQWPTPQIAAGGTITVPVLTGWVDPDGDPMVVVSATKDDPKAHVTVVPLDDGSVAIQHTDPNGITDGAIAITVTIADDHGGSATKSLLVNVAANPQLDARPIAVLAGAGQTETIAVADYVSGGSGSFRLVDATASAASDALVVVPNAAAGELDLSATKPGSYVVTYTVQDVVTKTEQSANIRLTVTNANTAMSMSPITAYVRANEDTTVDVLAAVQNTSNRVLIVSGIRSLDAGLNAGVVGQSAVRVRTTSSKQQPGLVGSAIVTVSNGNGASVEGQLTVFLVPRSSDVGAIAVADTVSVRAGSQVDIPVTANDVSPQGERLVVSPELDAPNTKDELAFVTGNVIRYLAPTKPGTYVLGYSVFLQSEPGRTVSSTVTITVIAPGTNHAPQPPNLSGRVLSGQTVRIPVDSFGTDPDGDAVVLAGVEQPAAGSGVATISAEGDAILYTAPDDGVPGGQATFAYSVRDTAGLSASGTVRVGVLNAAVTDPSPITYTDYVQAQAGSPTPIRIEPLVNDSDPSQGTLTLGDIVPNAAKVDGQVGEFERLTGLIDTSSAADTGVVSIKAGDVPGVQSYVYDVFSSAGGSNAQGLIVVTVSAVAAPSAPEVSDSVVTAKTRNSLASGIDVVSGHVRWPGGDVASLKLAVWGSAANRYSVAGHSISGSAPRNGDLVPFSLTGTDSVGNDVSTFGFLRIPAFDDMRVQLRAGLKTIAVEEEKSVGFDILPMLDVDSADSAEVRAESSYTVQRANSSCVPRGAASATYTAGREEPWSDYCVVPVRLAGQSEWTMLAVPIVINPQSPIALLNSMTVTISPGTAPTSIDLYESMTKWHGDRPGDLSLLDYAVSSEGHRSFVVTKSGATGLKIQANADAIPGTHESIGITVSNFGGLAATISLVVGIAPDDAPKGATFTKQCNAGQDCTFPLVGVGGEYDPLKNSPRSGLTVKSVGADTSVTCVVGTVTKKNSTSVSVTWPAGSKPNGGECIVPFAVEDAQHRIGVGQATLEVKGFPQTPASIVTTAYSATTVTLQVALGEAANAKPAVTGVTVWDKATDTALDPATYSCDPIPGAAYRCTVTGLVNGVQHKYYARAVSDFGSSDPTSAVTTSAYQAPVVSALTGTAVYTAGETKQAVATLSVSITSTDDTESFRIPNALGTTGKFPRTGPVTTRVIEVPPGSFALKVVPISRYSPPIGTAGNEGATFDGPIVTAIGGPYFNPTTPNATAASNTSIDVDTVALQGNGALSGDLSVTYIAWSGSGNGPTCSVTPTGGYTVAAGGVQSATSPITGLDEYKLYNVKVCGTNQFGVAESDIATDVFTGTDVAAPVGTYEYLVGPTAHSHPGDPGYFTYELESTTAVAPLAGFSVKYTIDGVKSSSLNLTYGVSPGSVTVRYCNDLVPTFCSDPVDVDATGAPTIAFVRFPTSTLSCDEEATGDDIQVSGAASGSANTSPNSTDTSSIPVTYGVTWPGANGFGSLDDITYDRDRDPPCTP